MHSKKIQAGATFPAMTATDLDGNVVDLGTPGGDAEWRLLVVYRGQHCPMCTKYLNALDGYIERLGEIRIDVVAVSADSEEQLVSHLERLTIRFPVLYGLTTEQLEELGLYISNPRSPQETDHRFPEPGLFVINAERGVQVVDISNNPFVRPDHETMVGGLEWIRNPDNNYPIRGTYHRD